MQENISDKSVNNKWTNWIPAIVMMAIIFGFSSIPGKVLVAAGLGRESWHVDGHFTLFLLLAFTYYKATKKIGLSVLFSFLYALSDEFHQKFVPLRSSSLKDIITDTVASLVAAFILWKLQRFLPKILKNWLNN